MVQFCLKLGKTKFQLVINFNKWANFNVIFQKFGL